MGVVDPLAERRQEAASFAVPAYPELGPCLAAAKPDLVVLASPTPFHARQALAAFEQGCDVFCDKPLAAGLEEADEVIAAMGRLGRKLMVYQPHRARPEIVALRDILAQGLIGPVYMMKFARANYTRRNDWQAFVANGGGMLNNYGAHGVDLALYLAGRPARRVCAALRSIASLGDADDVVKAVIETEDGVVLDLDINMATAHPMPPYHIFGRFGSVVFDEAAEAWDVRYFDPDQLDAIELQQGLAAADRRYGSGEAIPWQRRRVEAGDYQPVDFYEECYRYFALDRTPFVPVEQTREVMRVLDWCRRDGAAAD